MRQIIETLRHQPHSVDLEQALLGAVLMNQDVLGQIGQLDPADFYFEPHAGLFSIMKRLSDEGRRLTPATIAPHCVEWKPIGELSVVQYLGRLVANATTVINARDYARSIQEFAARRSIILIGEQLCRDAQDMAKSPAETAAEAIEALDAIIASSRSTKPQIAAIAVTAKEAIEVLRIGAKPEVVPTGILDLDRTLGGGWHKGELVIVGARPSMGKSTFAVMAAIKAAAKGHGAYFSSLEMSASMLATRALSDAVWNRQSPITYDSIRRREVQDYDLERLSKAADQWQDLPLIIDETPGLTVAEIVARCRQQKERMAKAGKTLSLLIVDHLGKIKPSSRYAGNKVHETGEKTNALAGLAKDLNIAVVALHQLNRGTEGRDDKRPTLADLRDSGDVEQDADAVMFLYRSAYYLERAKFDDEEKERLRKQKLESKRHDLEILVAKNRNGACKTVDAFIDVANNVIRDKAVAR